MKLDEVVKWAIVTSWLQWTMERVERTDQCGEREVCVEAVVYWKMGQGLFFQLSTLLSYSTVVPVNEASLSTQPRHHIISDTAQDVLIVTSLSVCLAGVLVEVFTSFVFNHFVTLIWQI